MEERKTAGAAAVLLEGKPRRAGGVNTRRVLEGGTAAGPEGGQLGSGWRQLGAGRGSWRLITAAAPGLRKEQSPKTNRGHSSPDHHSPSAAGLPSPGVASPGWTGTPGEEVFLNRETDSQHHRVRDWETHPLSSLHPSWGTRDAQALGWEEAHTADGGRVCALRRHRRQSASSPRGS